MDFTHFDEQGNARMVDVSEKAITHRMAIAVGYITISDAVFDRIRSGAMKKGDVLSVAQLAAIMGAKETSRLIPLCHPLSLTKVGVLCELYEGPEPQYDEVHPHAIKIEATVKTTGQTGVEMEALTAVQVGLLTVYDMCKAIDKGMVMGPTYLLEKDGGASGHFQRIQS